MKTLDEKLPEMSISKDQLNKDLRLLEKDLIRQLKNPKIKEFWDNTLGDTLKRVKKREDYIDSNLNLIIKKEDK